MTAHATKRRARPPGFGVRTARRGIGVREPRGKRRCGHLVDTRLARSSLRLSRGLVAGRACHPHPSSPIGPAAAPCAGARAAAFVRRDRTSLSRVASCVSRFPGRRGPPSLLPSPFAFDPTSGGLLDGLGRPRRDLAPQGCAVPNWIGRQGVGRADEMASQHPEPGIASTRTRRGLPQHLGNRWHPLTSSPDARPSRTVCCPGKQST